MIQLKLWDLTCAPSESCQRCNFAFLQLVAWQKVNKTVSRFKHNTYITLSSNPFQVFVILESCRPCFTLLNCNSSLSGTHGHTFESKCILGMRVSVYIINWYSYRQGHCSSVGKTRFVHIVENFAFSILYWTYIQYYEYKTGCIIK